MAQAANGPVTLDLDIAPLLEVEAQWSHLRTGNAVSFNSDSLALTVVMTTTHTVCFVRSQSIIPCSACQVPFQFSQAQRCRAEDSRNPALCTLSRPLYAYTDTNRRPADAGSRKQHDTSRSSNCTKISSRHR